MADLELIIPSEEQKKARKSRSIALGIALVAMVVIFYGITVYKMSGG
jgi:t-SNARE complex subunit (syntaxin)